MKKLNYKHTIIGCFIAYMVQAVVCNFAPLLFVGWSNEFNISMPQLTTIVTVTFFTQIVVDLISAKYAEKIGYKKCLVLAHLLSGAGFFLLGVLPYVMEKSFLAILIPVIIYSAGSGLLEVLVSPVVESCPTENKAGAMSLLHSFYCWGTVGVIGLSTLYFAVFSRENWRYLAFVWAVFALLNGVFLVFVPITKLKGDQNKEERVHTKELFKNKIFIVAVILMICAGASELAMSQWASAFAETGLNVSKTVGDLAGPMAFAVLMGTGRIIFSAISKKVKIEDYLIVSAVGCIASYMLACLIQSPVISLAGCALCGLAVSAMWPATISFTTKVIPNATMAMFAFLAVAGDIGCTSGPTIIGWITDAFGGDLKKGLIFSIIFPVIIIFSLLFLRRKNNKKSA